MERGMICDGETQLRVWARTLEVLGVVPTPQIKGGGGFLATQGASAAKKKLAAAAAAAASASSNASTQKYSSNDCTFLLLEPPHVPSVISEGVDCILFRELGIGRVARAQPRRSPPQKGPEEQQQQQRLLLPQQIRLIASQ